MEMFTRMILQQGTAACLQILSLFSFPNMANYIMTFFCMCENHIFQVRKSGKIAPQKKY
jgi:hypothetical protein